tara:strand:+ start:190 stop:663 length:474 start_codon:yes stop_codon:yes gene_type:complete
MTEPNMCPICYDELNLRPNENNESIKDDTVITLECGHRFHYGCINKTYRSLLKKYNSKKIRICPFCRSYGGYLPLKKGEFPESHVHKEYNLIKQYIQQQDFDKVYKIGIEFDFINKNKCQTILKTGVNKGKQCKKNKKNGFEYCCIHSKFEISTSNN